MANNNKLSNVNKELDEKYDKFFLDTDDIFESEKVQFKIYEKLLINSMNQTAGGTKPKIVGQMSEIVPKFRDYCIKNNVQINPENWKKWYTEKYPDAFDNSVEKIKKMFINFKNTINDMDDEIISKWLSNFLFVENIQGLLVQDQIMNYIKENFPDSNVRAATPKEEGKNIDIVISDKNYQVKPLSIKQGTSYHQEWGDEKPIWYKRVTKNSKPVHVFYLPKELNQK